MSPLFKHPGALPPAATSGRPGFEPGSLLTAWDLHAEQRSRRRQLWHHNRYLHGEGVICGLWVVPAGDDARPWAVRVCPGHALGCCGEEIRVTAPAVVDVRDWLWKLPLGQPPAVAWIGVRYALLPRRPVLRRERGCGCEQAGPEASRLADGFELEVLWRPPKGPAAGPDLCREQRAPCTECVSPHVVLARVDLPASESDPITAELIENRS